MPHATVRWGYDRRGMNGIDIDRARGEVRLMATVRAGAFNRFFVQPGHHAVVSRHGLARYGALCLADASDHDVRAALSALGSRPGENLRAETWTERDDPRSPWPDLRTEGDPLDVFVQWERQRQPIAVLMTGTTGLDYRYSGNERFRSRFRSGCIVCNYSCPGGAIGNRGATIRDEVSERVRFGASPVARSLDGQRVWIVIAPRGRR